MASRIELGRRIDEFVRELAEEFGDLPESDDPLITQIVDRAIEIGNLVMAETMELRLQSSASSDVRERRPARRAIWRRTIPTSLGEVNASIRPPRREGDPGRSFCSFPSQDDLL
jgi:hypothetical protein